MESNIIINKNKCIVCKTGERVCPSKCIFIIDSATYKFDKMNCCCCKSLIKFLTCFIKEFIFEKLKIFNCALTILLLFADNFL